MLMRSILSWNKNRNLILLICSSLLSGCYGPSQMTYPPVMPIDDQVSKKRNGAIYQEGHEISLYEDRTAHRVGDILTVRLEETTKATKNAQSKMTKTDDINNPTPTIFGEPVRALGFILQGEQKTDNKGESNQNNNLRGTISVTVTRVLPNQSLAIQGESWVTMSDGREFIQLTGFVREDDIGPDNTISSQRIAGAQITYNGTGQTGGASRHGFFMELFNHFAPY